MVLSFSRHTSFILAEGVSFEELGEGLLVFHSCSGDTHCLKGLEQILFKALSESPRSIDSLSAIASEILPDAPYKDIQSIVYNRIEQLEQIHLIGRQP